MKAHFPVGLTPNQADGQTTAQLAALGLVTNGAVESQAQHVQFGFGHGAFETEEESVVEQARVIKSVEITDEGIGDRTEVQQPIPLGVVACDPRRFQAEDDADLPHGHVVGHLGKAVTRYHSRPGVGQIFIHDLNLRFRPAQLNGTLAQLILPLGGLAVDQHLRGRGLTDVHVGAASPMRVLDFGIIAHGLVLGGRWEG